MSHKMKFEGTESEGGLLTAEGESNGVEEVNSPAPTNTGENIGQDEQVEWTTKLVELGNTIADIQSPKDLLEVMQKYEAFDFNQFDTSEGAEPLLVGAEIDSLKIYMEDPNPHTFSGIKDPLEIGYKEKIRKFIPFGKRNVDAGHDEDGVHFNRVEKKKKRKDKPVKTEEDPEIQSEPISEVVEPAVSIEPEKTEQVVNVVQPEQAAEKAPEPVKTEGAPEAKVPTPTSANPRLTFSQFSAERSVTDKQEEKPKVSVPRQSQKPVLNQQAKQVPKQVLKQETRSGPRQEQRPVQKQTQTREQRQRPQNGLEQNRMKNGGNRQEMMRRQQMDGTTNEEWDAIRDLFRKLDEGFKSGANNTPRASEKSVNPKEKAKKSESWWIKFPKIRNFGKLFFGKRSAGNKGDDWKTKQYPDDTRYDDEEGE